MLKCFVQDLGSKMPVVCVCVCVWEREDVIRLILNTNDWHLLILSSWKLFVFWGDLIRPIKCSNVLTLGSMYCVHLNFNFSLKNDTEEMNLRCIFISLQYIVQLVPRQVQLNNIHTDKVVRILCWKLSSYSDTWLEKAKKINFDWTLVCCSLVKVEPPKKENKDKIKPCNLKFF